LLCGFSRARITSRLSLLPMALVALVAGLSLLASAPAVGASRALAARVRVRRESGKRARRRHVLLCARKSSHRARGTRKHRSRRDRIARPREGCLQHSARKRHTGTKRRRSRHVSISIQVQRKYQAPDPVKAAIPANRATGVATSSSTCVGTGLTPTEEDLVTVRVATLCLINRERAAAGETALRLNEDLQDAAQGHAESMALGDYFEHTGPDGDGVLERLEAAGYISGSEMAYEVGENIAYGSLQDATPAAIVNAGFSDTGIGISPHLPVTFGDGQSGAMYTQDFGVVL
jgi:uncharacterized protein YkwD